jgi:2-iminobutanoate/2-iminopropanoate deaminase
MRIMSRRTIATPDAPAAIGPYSQAIAVGEWVFLSGQIPLEPNTGSLVVGDINAATTRVMENLRAVLAAADLTFDHVVKTTIYLIDLNDFAAVNAVYAQYFQNNPPARATVQVAALPRGVPLEIEAIAFSAGLKNSGI